MQHAPRPRRLVAGFFLAVGLSVLVSGAPWLGGRPSSAQSPTAPAPDYSTITVHAPVSTVRPDYEPYARFMRAFTTSQAGRRVVAYNAVEMSGREFLDAYIGYLEEFPIDQLSAADQRAFWLNLRNLAVVRAVALERRRGNLAPARGTGANPGPLWTAPSVEVRGLALSIEDLERRVLLARWPEPATLYGLYQGAVGGPELPEAAFEGASAPAALEAAGRTYLSDRRTLRVKGESARVGEFYGWYAAAVGLDQDGALLAHLRSLADGRAAKALAGATSVQADLSFDYRADEFVMREPQLPASAGFSGAGGGGGSGGS